MLLVCNINLLKLKNLTRLLQHRNVRNVRESKKYGHVIVLRIFKNMLCNVIFSLTINGQITDGKRLLIDVIQHYANLHFSW